MTEPLTVNEQLRESYFEPDHKLVVYFATDKFDEVWKVDRMGEIVQFYANLTECKKDCKTFKNAMKEYKITDTGPEDIYNMDSNPKDDTIKETVKEIKIRLRDNPDKNFLIFYILAGHGMVMGGR